MTPAEPTRTTARARRLGFDADDGDLRWPAELAAPAAGGIVGVGVDAIEIARVEAAVRRTPALLARVWTVKERARCTSRCGDLRVGGLAGRFAAKEAVAKALGSGVVGFGFVDVEIVNDLTGRPSVRLHRGAADRAAALGVADVALSLSTTADLALAYAVAHR